MKILAFLFVLQAGFLSQFLSEKEAYYSKTADRLGISNVPSKEQRDAIIYTAKNYFDPFRKKANSPLYVSSLYRSAALNKAVGGASNSDHLVKLDANKETFVAYDIDQDSRGKISNKQVFDLAFKSNFPYYKMIFEFGTKDKPAWVHISWSTNPEKNKLRKTYRAIKQGNKTIYTLYVE